MFLKLILPVITFGTPQHACVWQTVDFDPLNIGRPIYWPLTLGKGQHSDSARSSVHEEQSGSIFSLSSCTASTSDSHYLGFFLKRTLKSRLNDFFFNQNTERPKSLKVFISKMDQNHKSWQCEEKQRLAPGIPNNRPITGAGVDLVGLFC